MLTFALIFEHADIYVCSLWPGTNCSNSEETTQLRRKVTREKGSTTEPWTRTESATLRKRRCGTKERGRFCSSHGWNSMLEHRSQVLGCVVSSEFEHADVCLHPNSKQKWRHCKEHTFGTLHMANYHTTRPTSTWRHTCFSFTVGRLHLHCMWHLDNRHTNTHIPTKGTQVNKESQTSKYEHTDVHVQISQTVFNIRKLSKLNVFGRTINCDQHTWSKPNVTLVQVS